MRCKKYFNFLLDFILFIQENILILKNIISPLSTTRDSKLIGSILFFSVTYSMQIYKNVPAFQIFQEETPDTSFMFMIMSDKRNRRTQF